jgi:D-alanyl-D-alanine carboxypeptidase
LKIQLYIVVKIVVASKIIEYNIDSMISTINFNFRTELKKMKRKKQKSINLFKVTASLIVMLLFLVSLSTTAEVGEEKYEVRKDLQQIIDDLAAASEVPGLQAAVRVGDFSWLGTAGAADLEGKTQLKADHVFRLGSVTKTYTAALIMKLYEAGELDLDNNLVRWYPEYPGAEDITIRQLLNHTSGLYNYTEDGGFTLKAMLRGKKSWQPEELLAVAREKEVYFAPGTDHYYSNTNYILLGKIIEEITGQPLVEAYQDYIFTPLKLKNTFFVPYGQIPANLVTGYDQGIIPIGFFGLREFTPEENSFATFGYSAGAMAATAEDLQQWIDQLFSGEFIAPETLAEMMEYLPVEDEDVRRQVGYGLGLRVLEIDGDLIYGHTGTIPGFGAAAFYCPEKDYSVAVASNSSPFAQVGALEKLIAVINNNSTD